MNSAVAPTERLKFADRALIPLHVDELQDVRMIHAKDRHIGSAPRTPLLDGLGGDIVDLDERNGAGGDAVGGFPPGCLWV